MKKFTSYSILLLILLLSQFLGTELSIWISSLGAASAVFLSSLIHKINIFILVILLVFIHLILPMIILYAIGIEADMDDPFFGIFEYVVWNKIFVPIFYALIAYYLITLKFNKVKL